MIGVTGAAIGFVMMLGLMMIGAARGDRAVPDRLHRGLGLSRLADPDGLRQPDVERAERLHPDRHSALRVPGRDPRPLRRRGRALSLLVRLAAAPSGRAAPYQYRRDARCSPRSPARRSRPPRRSGPSPLPLLHERQYDDRLTTGSIAAGATLGILIPPSINMIIYGSMTNTSIGQLFAAGIVPGLILTALFMALIVVIGCPAEAEPRRAGPAGHRAARREDQEPARHLSAASAIFVIVMGSIYLGWATPTGIGRDRRRRRAWRRHREAALLARAAA